MAKSGSTSSVMVGSSLEAGATRSSISVGSTRPVSGSRSGSSSTMPVSSSTASVGRELELSPQFHVVVVGLVSLIVSVSSALPRAASVAAVGQPPSGAAVCSMAAPQENGELPELASFSWVPHAVQKRAPSRTLAPQLEQVCMRGLLGRQDEISDCAGHRILCRWTATQQSCDNDRQHCRPARDGGSRHLTRLAAGWIRPEK